MFGKAALLGASWPKISLRPMSMFGSHSTCPLSFHFGHVNEAFKPISELTTTRKHMYAAWENPCLMQNPLPVKMAIKVTLHRRRSDTWLQCRSRTLEFHQVGVPCPKDVSWSTMTLFGQMLLSTKWDASMNKTDLDNSKASESHSAREIFGGCVSNISRRLCGLWGLRRKKSYLTTEITRFLLLITPSQDKWFSMVLTWQDFTGSWYLYLPGRYTSKYCAGNQSVSLCSISHPRLVRKGQSKLFQHSWMYDSDTWPVSATSLI